MLIAGGAALAATAFLTSASLRVPSLTSFALAAYLAGAAQTALLAECLSALHGIGRAGYLAGQGVLLGGALAAWLARGRPPPPRLPSLHPRAHPLVAALALAVALAFAYELFLVLATPPNNWDSMTYHLTRASEWLRHGAVEYVPAATERVNGFPPVGELETLYTLVLAHSDVAAALPQFVAQLALVVGVFGIARRLGADAPAAAFAALLLPTLTEIALEAVTTQNDLVVASFVVASAYFALSGSRTETVLAGVALGLALGAKSTALFALPPLMVLVVLLVPRRRLAWLTAAAVAGFAVFGAYGYVLNLAETGRPFGDVHEATTLRPEVTLGGTTSTIARIGWRFVDFSGYHPHTAWMERVGDVGDAGFSALRIPENPDESTTTSFEFTPNVAVVEDVSFFGPLGFLLVLPLAIGGSVLWALRRVDARVGTPALFLPLYVIALAVGYRYNGFVGRFMITPVALTLPLAASLYRHRALAAAAVAAGVLTLGLALAFNGEKPAGLESQDAVWALDRPAAQALVSPQLEPMLRSVDRLDARRVGAVVGTDDWTYPLYGRGLDREVVYLDGTDALRRAGEFGLRAVVFGRGRTPAPAPGWRVRRLGRSGWALAEATT